MKRHKTPPLLSQIRRAADLKVGNIVLYYNYIDNTWQDARIVQTFEGGAWIEALKGELKGFIWRVDNFTLQDPEHYLRYDNDKP